jgi:hypothetical protein
MTQYLRETLRMNAQDKVLGCFPNSEARQETAFFEETTGALLDDAYWVIFTGPHFDAEELGRGRSEFEALAIKQLDAACVDLTPRINGNAYAQK